MRYVQLRAFHHVALSGGFSRAAERLHLTQPAVSDQVRKLEQRYDIRLFHRRNRQVELTRIGRQLLEITRRLFDAEAQAEEFLGEAHRRLAGTLRIVADSASHLLHLLAPYRAAFPDVEIVVDAGNSEQVVSALTRYQADIGVLGDVPDERDFTVIRLSATPLVAFAARAHPLAAPGREVTLEQLLRYPLVLREPGSKTRQKFTQGVVGRGYRAQPAIEAEGREAVREIVSTGVGVGIVSAAEFGRDERLTAIPIADCEILMEEALICLRERAAVERIGGFLTLARTQPPAGVR